VGSLPELPGGARRSSTASETDVSALNDLGLPALPKLPGPPPPAPNAELPWPLRAHPEAQEMPTAGGFGPLAATVGSAWLKTVRRRLDMARLAAEYRAEQPLSDVCGNCAVRASDPFVKERVGVWKDGARFRVYLDGNMRSLCEEFEKKFNVPPLALPPGQWQNFLDQKDAYQTLCCRCALEKGFTPPPPEKSKKKALSDQESTAQLKDKADLSDDDDDDDEGEGTPQAAEEDGSDAGSDKSDIELDPPDVKRFPNLVDVQVSQCSREMILFWAKQARRRLRAQRMAPQADSDDEGDDFGDGSD